MDRLDAMSVLVAVVEAGSLSAASRRLGTPLATVSRKVSELEEHLKSRLRNRSSRRMTLTDAGQSYVAACRRIIEEDRGDEGGIRPSRLPATRLSRLPARRRSVTALRAPRRNVGRRWSKSGPLHGQAQKRRSPDIRRPAHHLQ